MKETVVFDLDGILLSGDSTKAWLTNKLKSNLIFSDLSLQLLLLL